MSAPSGVVRRVRVHPSTLSGTVAVPGDKSISHRALLIGALVGSEVPVAGLAPSGDVAASAAALRRLGVRVTLLPDAEGRLVGAVEGPVGDVAPAGPIDCGNSGTSLRLLAGIAAGIRGPVTLTGDASLRRRPVDRIIAPLTAMGARCEAADGGRLPPLTIAGGSLHGVDWSSPVASAQVKSCVVLAGLAAEGPTTVSSPRPSRDHTERMLTWLGASIAREVASDGAERVTLAPGRLAARPLVVPRDPSSAAFWAAAAACGAGEVVLPDLCVNPTRDGALRALAALGARVTVARERTDGGEPVADVTVAPERLGGIALAGTDVVDALDELPLLALVGALSDEGIEVRDAAELRVKESDRIMTTAAMLTALGLGIETRPDGYRVVGGQRPRGGVVDAAGDHRIAMTAAVAGVLGTGPVEVVGFEAVATSYPTFLTDLEALGGRVERLEVDA